MKAQTRASAGNNAEAVALCGKALRLAAKELHDAYRDFAVIHADDIKAYADCWPSAALAALEAKAEAARAESQFETVLRSHAEMISRSLGFARFVAVDRRFTAAWKEQAPALQKQTPAGHRAVNELHAAARRSFNRDGAEAADANYAAMTKAAMAYVAVSRLRSDFESRYSDRVRARLKQADPDLFASLDRMEQEAIRLVTDAGAAPVTAAAAQESGAAAAAAYTRLAESLPGEVRIPTGSCPRDLAERVDAAQEAFLQRDEEKGLKLLAEACGLFYSEANSLRAPDVKAALLHLVSMSDRLSPALARQIVFSVAAAGLDFDLLCGSMGDECETVKRRLIPSFFEIAGTRDTVPLRKGEKSRAGFAFTDEKMRLLFRFFPFRIKLREPAGLPSLDLVLVPAGTILYPDDEGRVVELTNPRPFYMCADEISWQWLAAAAAPSRGKATEVQLTAEQAEAVKAGGTSGRLPAAHLRLDQAGAFCRWLGRVTGVDSAESATTAGDRFQVPTVEQWRFAACLDLLARAEREGVQPDYRWWKKLRTAAKWDGAEVRGGGAGDGEGWGFHALFGNLAELAVSGAGGGAARRCGGSFRSAFSPIAGFPLYDMEADEGRADLGLRPILTLDLSGIL